MMRPTGSLSAVMSKNTFGRLILPVGGFDFVEYDKMEANAPAYECFGTEQYWNCRRVNKRNVVDAIVMNSFGFRGYVADRRYNVQREWKRDNDWRLTSGAEIMYNIAAIYRVRASAGILVYALCLLDTDRPNMPVATLKK